MMIWSIFIISLVVASAEKITNDNPEYLELMRLAGEKEEFAKLLDIDFNLTEIKSASFFGGILPSEDQERQGANFGKYPASKWPGGRIYYEIPEGGILGFTSSERRLIISAINDFNEKVTNVKLVPRSFERDYVYIINSGGCWSYFGRIPEGQFMWLNATFCLNRGSIQQMFMHTAGIGNEHNRADRDNHITVLWGNITENWRPSYQKYNEDDFHNILSYDYDSITHFPIWSPGQWWLDAFRLPPGIDRNRLGQKASGMSYWDIQKLNRLYS